MTRRQIHPSELVVGQPLPCDAYDAKGKLLLREGHVLTSEAQIERLARHALFADHRAEPPPEEPAELRPLALVLSARQRLQRRLADAAAPGFAAEILRIGALLRLACRRNADVALASILLRRDGPYAIRHAVNVAIACELVGQALPLPADQQAATVAAALTMNIGMLDLQQALLAVEGPLDNAQHAAVRAHCETGVAMLRERGVDDPVWLEAVRDHHERPDGSGYPAGRSGAAIGLPARLLALGDVYCARVSARGYRPPLQPNVALRWLFLNEGAMLDRELAALFIKTVGIYPPGTAVRLRNGSIAVVLERGATSHAPKVASITTHDGLRTGAPIRRRNDVEAHAVSEVVDLDALRLEVGMEALWGADAAG